MIQRFIDKYRFVRLIKNDTNLGVVPSLNKMLALVSGNYLYCAAADDRILPGFFEKSMKLLTEYPQAGVCSAMSFVMDAQGRRKGFVLNPVISMNSCFLPPEKVRNIFLKYGNWIIGNTSILRFDYFKANGGFRPELYAFTDGFIEQVLALKYGACFIPEPLTCWRQVGVNYSAAISNKPEIYTKLIESAVSLMQTTFLDIFPKEYVDAWRRKNYFYLHHNIYKNMSQEKMAEISVLGKTKGFMGKLWICCFNGFYILEKAIYLCYLFFIFKQNPWLICYNRITIFFFIRRLSIINLLRNL